ncbi:hypothetical protein EYF80_029222 [Xyrichtys novacula]|uniref:Uncharacterized protein n=1 Tax=Xyrichtys novacula TaxID=13765 RepID=A0AAV1FLN0_XYRNO|nr:hypothetical protein EYF80_029222 [Xyrichtys novacula]
MQDLGRQMEGKRITLLTELVGLGPCLSLPSLPDGQHFGPHKEEEFKRKRLTEGGSPGDDETVPACHTPRSTPSPSLDCCSPLSCRDVSVKASMMLIASPAPQLSCWDSLKPSWTRTEHPG